MNTIYRLFFTVAAIFAIAVPASAQDAAMTLEPDLKLVE